jgi:adenylate kinase
MFLNSHLQKNRIYNISAIIFTNKIIHLLQNNNNKLRFAYFYIKHIEATLYNL